MMSETTVDGLARVMWQNNYDTPWVEAEPSAAEIYRSDARAALTYLRDNVTEEMVDRGGQFCGQHFGVVTVGANDEARDVFRAMINAALEGEG